MDDAATLLPILVGVVVLALLGFVQVRSAYSRAVRDFGELREYTQKFNAFTAALLAGTSDGELYAWLTRHVNHIHEVLGHDGIMAVFIKPYTRETIYNYALIMNTLPDLRRGMGDERSHAHSIMLCEDALLRGMGTIEGRVRELDRERRNPLVWLREGVRFVATLPIRLLRWLGYGRGSSFEEASNGPLGRLLTGAAWLIGLLASIIQIVQAWGPLMGFVGLGR